MKARCAVYTIAVEQSHRRHAIVGTHGNQSFGQRGAFEKTESRSGMEFYVHKLLATCCWLLADGITKNKPAASSSQSNAPSIYHFAELRSRYIRTSIGID